MNVLHDHYIGFLERYLGSRKNMLSPLTYLRDTPELIDVHAGELNAALGRFQRFRTADVAENRGLLLNSEFLAENMGDEDLPLWQEVARELTSSTAEDHSTRLELVFLEVSSSFEFIDWMTSSLQLLGTLFIGFYRTYTLVTIPSLRSKGVQVASTLEEMLALLAFSGCHTQLFEAVKPWILDFRNEGFSEELARRVAALSGG